MMAARTFSGSLVSQRARSTSIDFEDPVVSGGRRARERSSERASEGRWSPKGWCARANIFLARCSGERENFCRRYDLRSSYLMALEPCESSHSAICGNKASGRAAKTWSA